MSEFYNPLRNLVIIMLLLWIPWYFANLYNQVIDATGILVTYLLHYQLNFLSDKKQNNH